MNKIERWFILETCVLLEELTPKQIIERGFDPQLVNAGQKLHTYLKNLKELK